MSRRFIPLVALATAGCQHVDAGQIDYRVADAPAGITDRQMKPLNVADCKNIDRDCDPIQPSRVVRRYMADPAKGRETFKTDSIYSIEIEQGVVGSTLLEIPVFGHEYGKTAEIAILANVFEFADTAESAATHRFLQSGEFDGKADDPSDVELKLVYYSDDVKRNQPLNFSNIPLRPRGAYHGGSIGIQIVVMEIDAEAGPVSALLKTLARLGQQALPVPGEAKDILLDLGESLLSGSQDDRLFEYRFVLAAPGTDARASEAVFGPGRIVLRRQQSRGVPMDWANLRLDNNTGRLLRRPGTAGAAPDHVDPKHPAAEPANGDWAEVRDGLYMTVNVKPYPEGTKPEFYAQDDWSKVRAALQTAADQRAAPLDVVRGDLEKIITQKRSGNWRDATMLRWSAVRGAMTLYASRYDASLTDALGAPCSVTGSELARRRDEAERELGDALRLFRADYQRALDAKLHDDKGNEAAEFSEIDRDALVSAVAGAFMPWPSDAVKASFAGHEAFESSFIAAGASGDLTAAAITAATAAAIPGRDCRALLAR